MFYAHVNKARVKFKSMTYQRIGIGIGNLTKIGIAIEIKNFTRIGKNFEIGSSLLNTSLSLSL